MKLTTRVLLVLFAIVMFGPAQAADIKVQKWVDSLGQVHFGDQPPISANTEEMMIRTNSPALPGTDAAADKDKDKDAGEVKESEACLAAREQLANYERAPFLYETDSKGKKSIMSDEQRDELLDSVRQRAARDCKE